MQLLSELKHEGVVQMMDAYCQGGVVDILLELCSKGTMSQYVQKHFESLPGASKKVYLPPDVVDIKMAMRQLLKTLKYLHENHVAHRDVKPDNVLLASGPLAEDLKNGKETRHWPKNLNRSIDG